MKRNAALKLVIIVLVLFTVACNLTGQRQAVSPESIATAAAETAQVIATRAAFETLVVQATQLAQGTPIAVIVPTETPLPGQETDVPTLTPYPTLTPFPSQTVVLPSLTPQKTATPPPTLTVVPVPCNRAEFVSDITIPDGTRFWPNEVFTKVWRLKNTGSCTWNPDYAVVFTSGNAMNSPEVAKLNVNVQPGQMVDLVLKMKAPEDLGKFTGYWQMRTSSGAWFGTGPAGTGQFTTVIEVVKKFAQSDGIVFNFTSNFCAAAWSNSFSDNMYCPTVMQYRTMAPKLETGVVDDEPTLITVPSDGDDGFIAGRFPAYTVVNGDRFNAYVGCLADSPNCSVKFQLLYTIDGSKIYELGKWSEASDRAVSRADVDLSSLAGKKVRFILKVTNVNGLNRDDRAFWLYPRIVHSAPVPTVTSTNTSVPATATATATSTSTATSVPPTATATHTSTPTLVPDTATPTATSTPTVEVGSFTETPTPTATTAP